MLRPVVCRGPVGAVIAGLLLLAAAPAAPLGSTSPTRALVTVRTLVVDALGTRTVDTHTARVPFGHTALLRSKVPYAGPDLSFRLDLGVSAPQPTGIPVRMVSRTWNGEPGDTGASGAPLRDETTVLSRESSYLLELSYDPVPDRRILLSVSAVPIGEEEALPAPPSPEVAGRVQFLLEIVRQRGDAIDPADIHRLDSIVGRPVRYESGIRLPRDGTFLGAQVVLTPEESQGDLVTVKLEMSGAEALDAGGERVEPFHHREIRTVSSGSSFQVKITVPQEDAQEGDMNVIPVVYRVSVTTTLG